MQYYIEKKKQKTRKSKFFLRKTNQEQRKSIFNFYFYKTYQRHNLLDHSKPCKWLYGFFLFVFLCKFRSYNNCKTS